LRPAVARVATANAHTSFSKLSCWLSHGCAVASAGDDDHQQLHFKIMLASVVCVLVSVPLNTLCDDSCVSMHAGICMSMRQ
jgi:hypothetical protein